MMIFGVYLLIRKRAVLRYICRLLAGCSLPSGKHRGILTYIQIKVKNFSGYLAQLLRYTALPNARRTIVRLRLR
jgi:hypothetical protein